MKVIDSLPKVENGYWQLDVFYSFLFNVESALFRTYEIWLAFWPTQCFSSSNLHENMISPVNYFSRQTLALFTQVIVRTHPASAKNVHMNNDDSL